MESRSNYVATGAFVLLLLAGIVAAAVWLAGAQFNVRYATYEVAVSGSVSGLDIGAPVRLNGIGVGRVADIRQDPRDPQQVIVLLQMRQDATIRSDSVASLEMQGLTGERYIEISGGTLRSPRLIAMAGQRYPRIAWRPSSLDALFDNTPKLMDHLNVISGNLQALLDDQNRRAISETLANLNDLTTRLDERSQDIDHILSDGSLTLHNLARASARLDVLLAHFQGAPANVNRLVASANVTVARATKLADDVDGVVRASRPGLHELTTTVPTRLDALLTMASRLTASLDRLSAELERHPNSLLFGADQHGYRPR
jgi:phospholipid/cholesterol/gamma-HCH transport system substrate-binding protein